MIARIKALVSSAKPNRTHQDLSADLERLASEAQGLADKHEVTAALIERRIAQLHDMRLDHLAKQNTTNTLARKINSIR